MTDYEGCLNMWAAVIKEAVKDLRAAHAPLEKKAGYIRRLIRREVPVYKRVRVAAKNLCVFRKELKRWREVRETFVAPDGAAHSLSKFLHEGPQGKLDGYLYLAEQFMDLEVSEHDLDEALERHRKDIQNERARHKRGIIERACNRRLSKTRSRKTLHTFGSHML